MSAKKGKKAAPGVVGRENGCWCPQSESRPMTRCMGIDALTGRFAPCDDCPVRWAKAEQIITTRRRQRAEYEGADE